MADELFKWQERQIKSLRTEVSLVLKGVLASLKHYDLLAAAVALESAARRVRKAHEEIRRATHPHERRGGTGAEGSGPPHTGKPWGRGGKPIPHVGVNTGVRVKSVPGSAIGSNVHGTVVWGHEREDGSKWLEVKWDSGHITDIRKSEVSFE